MTHCEKCIHYDICRIDATLMHEDFVNFFPHNKDCKQFRDENTIGIEKVKEFVIRGMSVLAPLCLGADQYHLIDEALYNLLKEMEKEYEQ